MTYIRETQAGHGICGVAYNYAVELKREKTLFAGLPHLIALDNATDPAEGEEVLSASASLFSSFSPCFSCFFFHFFFLFFPGFSPNFCSVCMSRALSPGHRPTARQALRGEGGVAAALRPRRGAGGAFPRFVIPFLQLKRAIPKKTGAAFGPPREAKGLSSLAAFLLWIYSQQGYTMTL